MRGAGGRGCQTRSDRTSSSGSSPSRWRAPAAGRGGSPPSCDGPSGAGSGSLSRRLAVLRRFNLNTRSKRLALVARHADPQAAADADASEPGEKVQMDCFFIGRLTGSKGGVWQHTAADVASGYIWASCTPPSATAGALPPSSATGWPASSRPPVGGSRR